MALSYRRWRGDRRLPLRMTDGVRTGFKKSLRGGHDTLYSFEPTHANLRRRGFWARSGLVRYVFENYALDPDRRELRRGRVPVDLEPQVFDLLLYLVKSRDHVVSKDELIAKVWHGRIVSESALSTRLNAVRAALGDNGEEQRLVRTLPRRGVRFVGEVREDLGLAAANPVEVPPTVDKPSIAVLPFANLSRDPEQDYFSDGLVEDITT